MTAVLLTVAGIAIAMAGFFALAIYLTRDTGTRAAPRRHRGDWDEPDPEPEWLPAAPPWPPAPEVAHDEDWQTALAAWHAALEQRQADLDDWQDVLDERNSGDVIVADVYHPTPAGPPGDWEWREPFAWWLSDTNVGGMLAITDGRPS